MENKKQLVIVPPMSEPFQKLNEVLQGIAADENIEISIIDDPKELMQFMGSAGQSLVAFSNAKKCATFLQENRFVLAKTHSKVILLTPKEIPAKTLVKFVKIGLTESILENSPPKTLLYKVKLLLRSIKSSSQQEDKDQVVKSIGDSAPSAEKADLALDKVKADEASVNYLGDERAKFKTDKDGNAIDYGENLKGKTSSQEEAIETHWKGKRKQHTGDAEDDLAAQKVDDEESSEIDMYYRGKKQKKTADGPEEVEDDFKNKLIADEVPEELNKKKRSTEQDLDLAPAEAKTRKKYQEEEETDLFLKPSKDGLIIEAAVEETRQKKPITEEEKAENLKKELEELDALFAEAKKRQAEQAEDLGGHLKGKILNNTFEDDELPEIKEEKEYDNSELHERKKSFDLDLLAAEKEKRGKKDNEDQEEENAPHEGEVDRIDSNMVGENGASDKINTRMMSELGEDGSKKIRTKDIFDLDPKQNNENDEDDSSKEKKKGLALVENSDDDSAAKKRLDETDIEDDKKKAANLNLEKSIIEKTQKESENKEYEEDDGPGRKSTTLQMEAGEDDLRKSENDEINPHMAFKKLDQANLDLDKNRDTKNHHGKVDKIDTYYRGGEGKKTEHSWDNLDNRNRNINLQLEKANRREEESAMREAAKDLGEITIDYRKLKEEFEQMSRGEQSSVEDGVKEERSQSLLDSEDEGTFKVVELDARGFDFGINIVNLIYQKDSKPVDFYKIVAEELITKYKAYSVFYTFKPSDKKHTETFDSFMHFSTSLVSNELKEWWINTKTQDEIMNDYFSKSMATWLCREIENKSGTDEKYWEDSELPQWAANELTNKKVEHIFPYFDGVDRMGLAVVFFPEGLNPKIEKGLTVTLEMARTIFLESIQRQSAPVDRNITPTEAPTEKKKILSMFTGLFNRNKAG
jgi:hypothetical protein